MPSLGANWSRPGVPDAALEPARFEVTLRDLAWEWLYLPVAAAVEAVATRINVLQFLTIRRYLSLMFMALAVLLIVVAVSE